MLIAIELFFALITYFVITTIGAKMPSSGVAFLCIGLAMLFLVGLLLGNIWVLLVAFPILAGLGVLIGSVLGAAVNLLSSMTTRGSAKKGIWIVGLVLLVIASFHSKYRLVSDALTACDPSVPPAQEILTVFNGLENQQFTLILNPEFASISVRADHGNSFLWGSSKHSENLYGEELQQAACDLTRHFSRPILLDNLSHVIRISNETGALLGADTEHDYNSLNYIDISFSARHLERKFDQETVMPNGQVMRIKYRAIMTRAWQFFTDYHGLAMTFSLEGDADAPPTEQASRIVDIFDRLGYLTPADSKP